MKKLEIGDFLYTQMQQYGKTIYEVVNIGQQCDCKQNDKIMAHRTSFIHTIRKKVIFFTIVKKTLLKI